MDTFHKLTELFRQFPGIGPRQAKRFVFFLLSQDKTFLDELGMLASALKKEIAACASCFRFFQKRNSPLCPLCADKNRNESELMIVATDTDLDAVEKSNMFHGRYFVLGGALPLLEKKSSGPIRLKECVELAKKQAKNETLKEIILALNATPEGEHTALELTQLLSPALTAFSIKISTLGRGLSTGSELEYADSETIKSALKNRA